jgi:hypothetical protein
LIAYTLQPSLRTFNLKLTGQRILAALGLLVVSVSFFTWMIYDFELRPAKSLPSVIGLYKSEPNNRFLRTDQEPGRTIKDLLTAMPIPAARYFQGLDQVMTHNRTGQQSTMPAYLLGKDSTLGWWYYFPVAFVVKTPLPILILLGLTLFLGIQAMARRARAVNKQLALLNKFIYFFRSIPFSTYALFLPSLLYFMLSLTSHINLGVRHLLPILPFVYIGLGYLFSHPVFRNRLGTVVLSGFLISTTAVAGFTYPNQLSYFSELVGGSRFGPKYLLDSNLDWGQGFYALRSYIEKYQPKPFYGAFFTSIDLSALQISALPMPEDAQVQKTGIRPGTYAISAMLLYEPIMPYHWLQHYTPTRILQGSIYIFEISK